MKFPHHGFNDDHILRILNYEVHWDHRNALNSASKRDFMTKSTKGAFRVD